MDNKDIFSMESEMGGTQKPPRMVPKWLYPTIAVFLIIAMLVSGIFIGLNINNVSMSTKNMSKDMPLLEEIYSYIDKYYYKDIDWNQLQEQAASGMAALDKFSGLGYSEGVATPKMGISFIYSAFNEATVRFIDIASPAKAAMGTEVITQVDYDTKIVTVAIVANGSKSMKIERGDKLIAIKNNATNGNYIFAEYLGSDKLSAYLNTALINNLVFEKTDGKFMEVTVGRDFFDSQIGEYKNLGNNVGYISLYEFDYYKLDQIFDLFKQFAYDDNANKLILDLNYNGGGDARVLQEISSFLIPYVNKAKTELIKIDGKGNNPSYYCVDSNRSGITNNYLGNVKTDFELALLVNGNSASASEALTGVVMAYNPSAFIVGTPTYGKGVSQSVFSVGNGKYLLSIVTGYFYIPSYDANNKLIWTTHHEKPIVPKDYNFNNDNSGKYGILNPDISKEADIKYAMELLK